MLILKLCVILAPVFCQLVEEPDKLSLGKGLRPTGFIEMSLTFRPGSSMCLDEETRPARESMAGKHSQTDLNASEICR